MTTIGLEQLLANVRLQIQQGLGQARMPGPSETPPIAPGLDDLDRLMDRFSRVTNLQAPMAPMFGTPVSLNSNAVQQANNAAGSGFNGAAHGPWPHKELDIEMARVSEASYTNAPAGNWRPLSQEEVAKLGIDPGALNNPQNGMESTLYTDGRGRYALAFRGNDGDPGDIDAVARQVFGLQSPQVDSAMHAATQVKNALGDQVIFTGHSLGGGLAAIAAANTNTTAVTFAAQGVHDRYLGPNPALARAKAEAGQIRTYNVAQDPLMLGQRLLRWTPPLGVERTLNDPMADPGNIGASHNAANLIAAMEQQL